MKKIITLFFCATIAFYGCKKDEAEPIKEPIIEKLTVAKVQKSIGYNITATWCGPCGQDGLPKFNQAISNYPETFIGVKTNVDDNLASNVSEAIANDYNASSIPSYVEGATKIGGSTAWLNAIANRIAQNDPIAGIGLEQTVVDNKVKVKTRVLFFKEGVQAKYSLVLYLLEDGIVTDQSGASPRLATHNRVLRTSSSAPYPWGEVIKNGTFTVGEDFEKEYTINIPASVNKSNMKIAAALFTLDAANKPNGFINAQMAK